MRLTDGVVGLVFHETREVGYANYYSTADPLCRKPPSANEFPGCRTTNTESGSCGFNGNGDERHNEVLSVR